MGWRGDASNFVQEIENYGCTSSPSRLLEGWVTVEGLAYNSTVHITTLSGRAVALCNPKVEERFGTRDFKVHWP